MYALSGVSIMQETMLPQTLSVTGSSSVRRRVTETFVSDVDQCDEEAQRSDSWSVKFSRIRWRRKPCFICFSALVLMAFLLYHQVGAADWCSEPLCFTVFLVHAGTFAHTPPANVSSLSQCVE